MKLHVRSAWFPLLLLALAGMFTACDEHPRAATTAPAADEAAVAAAAPGAPTETGSIEGRIRFDGAAPAPGRIPTNASVARHCGAEVADRSLVISKEGGVAFAVASVDDLPAGPAADPASPMTVEIDNRGCLFFPAVAGARAGATIAMKNSDPLTHSVRANANGRELYNVAMPLEGMVTKKALPKRPGVVRLVCDIHPWMNARIKTFAHPYFDTADETGAFHIDHVPVGTHRLTAWHPRLGERSVEIEVKADAPARAELHFGAADVRPLE